MSEINRLKICLVLISMMLLCCGCSESQEITPYDVSQITQVSFVIVDPGGTITEVESLNQEAFASFFEEFAQLQYHKYWNDPIDSVVGSAILITFQDGTYHLINNYCTIYHKEGKSKDTRQCYTQEDFSAFWNEYCSHEYYVP